MRKEGKLWRSIVLVWASLSAFSLVSCVRVDLSDQEWCGDIGPGGAICFHTFSNETRDIPKPEWDSERVGYICGKADAFAELKQALLRLCHLSKACWRSKHRAEIENFGEKLGQTQATIDAIQKDK